MRDIFKFLAVAATMALSGGTAVAAQTANASGPSSDCARASTAVERMICADAELRALDRGIAAFYASGMRNARPARAVREQREWLTMRDGCDARPCLRAAMMDRLRDLSEAVGPDLPAYSGSDGNSELVVADLGDGWYAFGAVGYYYGPTINSASASGAARLQAGRATIAGSEFDCPFTLTRLPNDGWRLAARPTQDLPSCGGANATVEGTYRRSGH